MLDSMRANAQSWGMKLAFGIIILVFVFWGIGSVQAPTGIVATVNGEQITFQEVEAVYSRMESELQQVIPGITEEYLLAIGVKQAAFEELVLFRLLEAESKRTGIDVSLISLRNNIESYPFFHDATGKFNKALYLQILKNSGQSPASFEQGLRQQMLPALYKHLLSAGLYLRPEYIKNRYIFQLEKRSMDYVFFPYNPDVQKVSKEEIEKLYLEQKKLYALPARLQLEYINFNPEKMATSEVITEMELEKAYIERKDTFTLPEQVKARHIILELPETASESEEKAVLDKIKSIEQELRAGADFSELAKKYGQDASAQNGGDLGWFAKEQMVPTFADAAFSLNIGQLSAPIKTNFGYHLILLDEKKAGYTQTLKDVEDDLRIMIATEKVNSSLQNTVDTALTALMSSADVEKDFTKLAKKYKLSFEKSELLDATSLVQELGLRPADVQILMTAPKGRVWDTAIGMGNGLSVVRISESLPAMTKPLSEVEDGIKETLAMEMARTAAMDEAKKALLLYAEKSPANAKIKQSEFISRDGVWSGMGQNKALAKELFVSDDKEWKSEPYRMDKGAVLVRLKQVEVEKEVNYLAIQSELAKGAILEQTNIMYDAFIHNLRSQADIDVLIPEFKVSNAKL